MIVTKEKRSYQRREVFRHVTYEASSPAQKTNAIDAAVRVDGEFRLGLQFIPGRIKMR
jgi:hypothetical protein